MKFVFAVTFGESLVFEVMTAISARSVRLSNPNAEIIVVRDEQSASELSCRESMLTEEVDTIVEVATPPGNPSFRNRHVKTRLRELITGPFMFLDSDTLVRGRLDEIFDTTDDIGAARNHSRETVSEQVWEGDRRVLDEMGWRSLDDTYFNGGVLFYNDTPEAYDFGRTWHRLWCESSRNGNFRDQPSLNAALRQSNCRVRILEDRFNAQVRVNPGVASGAVVWHFYSSADDKELTEFDRYCTSIHNGQPLEDNAVLALMRHPHPWRHEHWLDDWHVRRMMRRGRIDDQDLLWLRGFRTASVKDRLRATKRRWERRFRQFFEAPQSPSRAPGSH